MATEERRIIGIHRTAYDDPASRCNKRNTEPNVVSDYRLTKGSLMTQHEYQLTDLVLVLSLFFVLLITASSALPAI